MNIPLKLPFEHCSWVNDTIKSLIQKKLDDDAILNDTEKFRISTCSIVDIAYPESGADAVYKIHVIDEIYTEYIFVINIFDYSNTYVIIDYFMLNEDNTIVVNNFNTVNDGTSIATSTFKMFKYKDKQYPYYLDRRI